MVQIKFNKILISILVLLGLLINVYSATSISSKICFEKLIEEANLNIKYEDIDNDLKNSDHYAQMKYWDGLHFSKPRIYLKFGKYGTKSSFEFEHDKFEIIKYGRLEWENSYEYMFFEQYITDDNNNYHFSGCGFIHIKPLGNYTYQTLINELYWGNTINDSDTSIKDYQDYLYKKIETSSYDIYEQPFAEFNVHRIIINDNSLPFNLYEISKNHGIMFDNLKSIVQTSDFVKLYSKKIVNVYPEVSKDLRIGFLPMNYFVNEYENLKFEPLKNSINFLMYPSIFVNAEIKGENTTLDGSYQKIIFLGLEKKEFETFLYELAKIDNEFSMVKYREIETNCLSKTNYECIGEDLIKYLNTISNNQNAVNFFTDLVLRQENENYKISMTEDYFKLVIEDKKDIFPLYERPQKTYFEKIEDSNTYLVKENKIYIIVGTILVALLICLIVVLFTKKHKNNKKE